MLWSINQSFSIIARRKSAQEASEPSPPSIQKLNTSWAKVISSSLVHLHVSSREWYLVIALTTLDLPQLKYKLKSRLRELMLFMHSKLEIPFIMVTFFCLKILVSNYSSLVIKTQSYFSIHLVAGARTMMYQLTYVCINIKHCSMMEHLTLSILSWLFGHHQCTTEAQLKFCGTQAHVLIVESPTLSLVVTQQV